MPDAILPMSPDVCPCRVPAPFGKRLLPPLAKDAPVPFTVASRYFPDVVTRRHPREQTPSQAQFVLPVRLLSRSRDSRVIPTDPFSTVPSGPGICVTTVICVISREMDRVLRHGPRRLRHGDGICVMGHQLNCIDLHRFARVQAARDGRDANDANFGGRRDG